MKFAVLVQEGPYQHQSSDSAYHFVKAALEKGHEITGVFFYNDGVLNANKLIDPQQDDRNVQKRWSDLAEKGVELVVCIAAAKRRGINDDILAPGFKISGLGQLTEMAIESDRLVTFGA
ncbi:MAG: sulfurtransferase complex subunit TusD [Actinomycetota bacterium]|nr:sulfurtransferase complex subunit TusD [Actinomycetota bacterium]